MKKKEYEAFVENKKDIMHYEEMSEEDQIKFDEQHEINEDEDRIDYTDSKHEGDYINEEDLKIDESL